MNEALQEIRMLKKEIAQLKDDNAHLWRTVQRLEEERSTALVGTHMRRCAEQLRDKLAQAGLQALVSIQVALHRVKDNADIDWESEYWVSTIPDAEDNDENLENECK